jgi:ligand-binding sensor domain-containing protein/signal transduction histidine kinase
VGRFLTAGLLILCSANAARALDPNRTMSQYVVERWSTDQDFLGAPVYSIGQTADGYLVVATSNGLSLFDGFTFKQMHAADFDPSLIRVAGLITDAQGALWLRLSSFGTTMLRYENGVFHNVVSDLPSTLFAVDAIARGRDGTALCLLSHRVGPGAGGRSTDGGIVPCDKMSDKSVSSVGFPESAVLALAQTSDGDFWLGTADEGLFRIHNGRAEQVKQGLPDLKVDALAPGANGELWVATDAGIVRWDGAKLTRTGIPDSLGGVQVLAMMADTDSNLWLGTNSRGLLRLNAHGLSALAPPDVGTPEAITSIFEDREGNIWAGGSAGLVRLRDSPFIAYSQLEGLPSAGGTPVFVDSVGRTWFAPVSGGLMWFRGENRGRVSSDGLTQDVVYSIDGRDSDLWIGRQQGGLTHLRPDDRSFRAATYTEASGLAQNSVYSVFEADDGSVWAGTVSGGVSHVVKGRVTTYRTFSRDSSSASDGLISNTVNSIAETPDGTMWFATPTGLSAFSQGRWKSFTKSDGLPSDEVDCMLMDSSGVLWVGTTAGLAFRGSAGFKSPGGVPVSLLEPILGMAEGRLGSLWVSTTNHVLKVNRTKLEQSALTEEDVREFSLADGLRAIDGVKRDRSVVADSSGRIWLSLNRAIEMVDPTRLGNDAAPAIANIQAFSVDGKSVDMREGLHISGSAQRINFDYVGLGLSTPERVRFRYMLQGFDRTWSQRVGTRQATYTNLPPAHYRFRVMAANPDGVWSARDATFAFEVDPLFYQTWWFRALIVAASVGFLWTLYQIRLHQMHRQFERGLEERVGERTRIARELHDTLLQSFHGLMFEFQAVRNMLPQRPENETAIRALDETILGTERALAEGRDAIQGLRPQESIQSDLAQLLAAAGQEFSAVQDANSHSAKFRVIVEGEPQALSPMLQDEVYRIGREVISNAFRHAVAHEIEAEIRYDRQCLRLRIRDDGQGIDPKLLERKGGRAGHWGLPGIRERTKRIGSQLDFWTQPGAGTEVELTIPATIAYEKTRDGGRTKFSGKEGSSDSAAQRNSHPHG